MVETAIATWTTAAIAGILPLHACPARCGARRRCGTAKLRSAPCLPLESSKLLRATQAGSQPDADQRNSNISSTSAARLRPLCPPEPTLASDPVGIRRRIDAGSDRHRHRFPWPVRANYLALAVGPSNGVRMVTAAVLWLATLSASHFWGHGWRGRRHPPERAHHLSLEGGFGGALLGSATMPKSTI